MTWFYILFNFIRPFPSLMWFLCPGGRGACQELGETRQHRKVSRPEAKTEAVSQQLTAWRQALGHPQCAASHGQETRVS